MSAISWNLVMNNWKMKMKPDDSPVVEQLIRFNSNETKIEQVTEVEKIVGTVLVNNSEAYQSQYVTTKDFDSKTVVSANKSAKVAYELALELGHNDPVLMYIPTPEEVSRRKFDKYAY